MDTGEDIAYKQALRGKKYMMGISPYFYTSRFPCRSYTVPMLTSGPDLPQWNKNWYSSSESLWFDRWQQVLDVKPDFVEIITCQRPPAPPRPGLTNTLQGTTTASRATSATRTLAK